MSVEVALFLVGQGLVILGAIIGTYIKTREKITELSGEVSYLKQHRAEALDNHKGLREQVSGLSRVVERHDVLIDQHEIIIRSRAG